MRRLLTSLALATLAAALLLPAPPAAATPRGDAADRPAWTWLGDLLVRLRPLWGATGPEADPNGFAAPAPRNTGPDADPDGFAAPRQQDTGPELDPNGFAAPTEEDTGPGLDPNG